MSLALPIVTIKLVLIAPFNYIDSETHQMLPSVPLIKYTATINGIKCSHLYVFIFIYCICVYLTVFLTP